MLSLRTDRVFLAGLPLRLQELSKAAVGVSPGPQAYALKGFFGPRHPLTHERARSAFMGTDPRDSAEQREMKAMSLSGGGRRITL